MAMKPQNERPSATEAARLNPALKQVHDATYGPDHNGTDPMATVSVQKDEGTWWPMIWALTSIACLLITIALIVF